MVDDKEKKAIVNYQVRKDSEFIFMTPIVPGDDRGIRDFMVALAEPIGLDYRLGHCYLTKAGKLAITKSGYRKLADDIKLSFSAKAILDDIPNQRFVFEATATTPDGRTISADGCADGLEKKFIGKDQYDAWKARGWKDPPTMEPTQWWKVRNNAETRAKNRVIEDILKITVVNAEEINDEEEKPEYKKNAIPVQAEDPFDNTPLKTHETKRAESNEFVLDIELPTEPTIVSKPEPTPIVEQPQIKREPEVKQMVSTTPPITPKEPSKPINLLDLDLGDLGNFGATPINTPVETIQTTSPMVVEKLQSPLDNISDEELANEEALSKIEDQSVDIALAAACKYDPCSTKTIQEDHTDMPFEVAMEVLTPFITKYLTYNQFIKGIDKKNWFGFNKFIPNAKKDCTLYEFTLDVAENFVTMFSENCGQDWAKITSSISINLGTLFLKIVAECQRNKTIESQMKACNIDPRFKEWFTRFVQVNKLGGN